MPSTRNHQMVASNHLDGYTVKVAPFDRVLGVRARGIGEGKNAEEPPFASQGPLFVHARKRHRADATTAQLIYLAINCIMKLILQGCSAYGIVTYIARKWTLLRP